MNMQSQPLGRHILVEYFGCDRSIINDLETVRSAMLHTAEEIQVTVINEVIHQFNPHGISGVVVIAESHLAIHTWPDHGCVSIDIFSCQLDINPDSAIQYLKTVFRAETVSVVEMARGLPLP